MRGVANVVANQQAISQFVLLRSIVTSAVAVMPLLVIMLLLELQSAIGRNVKGGN